MSHHRALPFRPEKRAKRQGAYVENLLMACQQPVVCRQRIFEDDRLSKLVSDRATFYDDELTTDQQVIHNESRAESFDVRTTCVDFEQVNDRIQRRLTTAAEEINYLYLFRKTSRA